MNLFTKLLVFCIVVITLVGCGNEKKEEKETFKYQTTQKKQPEIKTEVKTPIDMDNIGVGPVESVKLSEKINAAMVEKGKEIFNTKCIACHLKDKKLIGPPMKGVLERRNPVWVMNMIVNPEGMLKEDPIAKALLKEYNNAMMINQNVSEEEARSLLEYIRGDN